MVLALAVEPRRSQPVLQRELIGVLDPQPALLGAVDEEQPAERPERLAAEVVAALLVDDGDAVARPAELVGGDQARQPGADDDDARVLPGAQGASPANPAAAP
jgi:hypothetical protein